MNTQPTKTQLLEATLNGETSMSAIEPIALSAPARNEFTALKM